MNVMPEKGCLILETLAEPKRTVMIHLTSTKYEISPDSLQEGGKSTEIQFFMVF